ncbi:SCP2 sterol-binding domain-containing protein [Abyssibius alkaniclasticus]|uniref:SCP2 sterol-binding domain-containing protein n=1 Tax=Abyssibius alkaniclasticus TaxID=2881234 RepID=UPI0023637A4F|nr:SCP2 sterol-binding domain-containing protein [Abyssibius alkaniclasticus]UPH71002.1 SCP2 sterol-binding domain-containing protein [Abyssibius alkaniclasticus]|tara:strand:- start:564 stop:854 length:291 start_codon:yes stop_codon:yes gene_type:complete
MSEVINEAVAALNAKLADGGFDGSVKFEIEGEGAVRVDETGASASDAEADCTISASAETFRRLLEGDLNPAGAFMSGKLKVDGDMGTAMRLGSVFG